MSGAGPLLVVFEGTDVWGEAEGIMWSRASLPHSSASLSGCGEETAPRKEAPASRTQSRAGLSEGRGRAKPSKKLTTAHSGSSEMRISEDERNCVYYQPRAFKDLEGVA